MVFYHDDERLAASAVERNTKATDALLARLHLYHPMMVPEKTLPEPELPPTEIAPAIVVRAVPGPVQPFPKGLNPVTTIVRAAARHSGYPVSDIMSQRRRGALVRVRHIAMYLAYRLTGHSMPWIGARFGGRDHTTILHAVRKIEHLVGDDERLNDDMAAIRDIAIEADPALGARA